QFEVAADLPRALLLDRLRLRQVLVNLLGNALKFTERGYVKTRLSWQKQNGGSTGTLLIDVEDTGIGIPADKLQEIFKSFVLLDIRMPVMDGRTTLTEIRKRPELASLPVIAVTASSKACEDAELRSRFSDYIRKPFSRQTLFMALAQFLQQVPRKVSTAEHGL